ncbi:MAG: DUF937 domain-containing protein [Treponema sp.]|nr:DUF937 domain-containing protein [Treponema sp.]
MDVNSLLTGLVSASNIKKISTASEASTTDVKNVLAQAVPVLIQGAASQAKGSTASGFEQALSDHASDKSKTLNMEDGAKIISHLLGSKASSTTGAIAKAAGVTKASATSILSAAAPLFMSLLGQQTSGTSGNALGSLLGGLTSNLNVGSLLGNLLGAASASTSSSSTSGKKKDKKDKKDSKEESGAGNLLNGIMGLLK